MGGEAEIASLTADFHETGRQRIGGAEKQIVELAPNAKVVNRTEAILAPEAFETTQSILQANPNVNVILCIADDGCLGAAQAFEATGRDPNTICIVGWDGSREVMKRIMEGGTPIRATGALDLLAIGRSAIWVPANILENKEPKNYNERLRACDRRYAGCRAAIDRRLRHHGRLDASHALSPRSPRWARSIAAFFDFDRSEAGDVGHLGKSYRWLKTRR